MTINFLQEAVLVTSELSRKIYEIDKITRERAKVEQQCSAVSDCLREKREELEGVNREIEQLKRQRVEKIERKIREKEGEVTGNVENLVESYFGGRLIDQDEPFHFFGAEHWKKYLGIDVSSSQISEKTKQILESECPYWKKGRRIKNTHMLVWMPKDMTLSGFCDLIREKYSSLSIFINEVNVLYRDQSTGLDLNQTFESGWMLMTREAIPESSSKSYDEQKKMIKDKYRAPYLYEAIVAIFLEYLRTKHMSYLSLGTRYYKKRFRGDNEWWVLSCADNGTISLKSTGDGVGDNNIGIGAVRRIK